MANKKLFLVGPGFIGGTLLVRLKEARPDLTLSALTRRKEQADELRSLGVEPVMGDLSDAETIKKHASESDIIIHTATADDAPSAFAIVEGIKSRKDPQSKKVVYIHTSGNDELAHSAKDLAGTSPQERTLSDAKGDQVLEDGRILPDAYHRHVDGPLRERLFNEQAEKEYNVATTIMMPPLIYGVGAEPWKRISIQSPMATERMITNGLVTFPEGFKGVWNAVSVHDLVEAYIVLLKDLEAHTPGQPQPSHYCFPAEPQPFPWKDLFDGIIEQLKKQGIEGNVKVLESAKAFEDWLGPDNPYKPCFSAIVFGQDSSYTHPDRLFKLGYKHKAKGPVDSIVNGDELTAFIKEQKAKNTK